MCFNNVFQQSESAMGNSAAAVSWERFRGISCNDHGTNKKRGKSGVFSRSRYTRLIRPGFPDAR